MVSTDGGEYVVARQQVTGKPAAEVLALALPSWIADLRFPRGMRWNQSNCSFSRPIRWLVALLGSQVIPFRYADLESGRTTRGPRPAGSPDVALASAASYRPTLATYGVIVDTEARSAEIWQQVRVAAAQTGGEVHEDPDLLDEVPRPLRQLPGRALRLAAAGGPSSVLTAVRSWAEWRLRRALAQRELRRHQAGQ